MNLVIPGIVTIIVTFISGYFAVKVAQTSKTVEHNATVAKNGAKVAEEKSSELSDALDLLHSMNQRLEKIERERDECREELKTTREHNEELQDLLGMTKRRTSTSRKRKR